MIIITVEAAPEEQSVKENKLIMKIKVP